ncbi:hypothetical protein HNR00_002565 [Methylorubrum rhodinum]|jgi:hypothetical protein|uniref:Uncharacterized protein n=1 Tax=Methylorubrum rhodinum TaxID=29428 RepID=A0A840ZIU5_9HYPH|nr:hypothetical protein [Methylorubrum rhodinum]MBB5757849.1 hypothetical protein [Methylorubrum rhodinum]
MKKTVAYFRAKARTCRRLARSLGGEAVPAVAELEALAAEFEALAVKLETGASAMLDDRRDGFARREAALRRH